MNETFKKIVMRQKTMALHSIVAAITVAIGASGPGAIAEAKPGVFVDWEEPSVVSNLEGFEGSVRIEGSGRKLEVMVAYTYPNGAAGSRACLWDEENRVARFSVPAEPEAGLGVVTYHVEVVLGKEGVSSATRRIPMLYAEELDITGEAAVPLLYPLPDEAYQVRYVPCCNIYGGVTDALRSPVNPTGTDVGLPKTLVSDFVVLEPDGLSASTSGMYFEFTYDVEKVKALGDAGLALYEWDGDGSWSEALSYDVDETSRKVSFHCPDGGAYVLGVKG